MNETKVKCPCCGAEFAIPSHSHMVAGVAIGKDSNLGTIYLPLDKEGGFSKAEHRLMQLREAGVDTSNFYAMSDGESVGRIVGGTFETIDDVETFIANSGVIPNRRLFRRWIMAQMFRMLSYESYNGKEKGYTDYLHRLGYEYQFKMVKDELYAQMKMEEDNDTERLIKRQHFFNVGLVVAMVEADINNAFGFVAALPVRKCKGRPYKTIRSRKIFTDKIQEELFSPMEKCLKSIKNARDVKKVYQTFSKYMKMRVKLNRNTKQFPKWVDAFKGAGAYYTMDNLILFHGCLFKEGDTFFTKEQSKELLDKYLADEETKGWQLLGILKKLLADNNIDIEEKMRSWCKD